MHLKRWLTSIVALPLLFGLIVKGGPLLFTILIGAVSVVALYEYHRMVFAYKGIVHPRLIPWLGYATAAVLMALAFQQAHAYFPFVLACNIIVCACLALPQYKGDRSLPDIIIKQVAGVVYIAMFLSFLVLIRMGPQGVAWILGLLCIIIAGDVGAYYVGSYCGRHKLCPAVSPGKTIEGAIGGLAANVVIGSSFWLLFLPPLHWGKCLLYFLFVGAVGQVGDLFESQFKRSADIKDSGVLLPGHGGMLDRIDALLFAAPVAFFFQRFIF